MVLVESADSKYSVSEVFIPFQVSQHLTVFNVSPEPVTFTTLKDCRLATAGHYPKEDYCITLPGMARLS